jgi:RNA polymerase sigma-70 factor (ECF subfamily)
MDPLGRSSRVVGRLVSQADEDSDLMRRVAADEPAAFERLVERVLPRLLGYFRRMGADRALAEDCAQEVLFKVYRVRRDYVPRARFVTYLLHIARNHWIDVYRHRRLGPITVSSDAGGSGDDDDAGGLSGAFAAPPDAGGGGADAEHLKGVLDAALGDLTPEHREAFVLAHLETLRYEEIGALLGIPVGTVKSRVHTAIRMLREGLRRRGVEP